MTTKKKYYTQNTKKRTVTIDKTVTPTDADRDAVSILIQAGYILKEKSVAKSNRAKERIANDKIKKASDIDLDIFTDKQKEEYNTILHGKGKGTGYFSAKSYYKSVVEELKVETTV